MVVNFAETSLAQADTSQGAGTAGNDQFKLTLGDIDRQIEAHEKSDHDESYLGKAFDFIWRQDENSLKKLREMRAQVEDLQKKDDVGALEKMQEDVRRQIEKDGKAVKLQENINFYGGTTLKVAGIFVGGPVGWAATGALYALDSARPEDSIKHQVVDATLGAAEGMLLKGAFGVVRGAAIPIAGKGVAMGVTSRFLDSSLDRHTYLNPETGNIEVGAGLERTFKATFNPTALATDAAVFAVGFGASSVVQKFAGSALAGSPLYSNLASAGTWGVSSGSVREAVRQVVAKEAIDVGKIAGHGLLGGALFTVAALPGSLQAEHEYQKLMAANNHDQVAGAHGQNFSEFRPKGAPVHAEQLKTTAHWTSGNGDHMTGEAGDWKLTGADGSTWTVKPSIFDKTYSPVPGQEGVFMKTAITRAMQLNSPMTVETLEGTGSGATGDYLVIGAEGEKYIVPRATFEGRYSPVASGSGSESGTGSGTGS
ncbi:MAG: hypothetical protein KC777_13445 [Cyanobacteria bacterium HKST-UBA02]|nr:hypothetical protein [Cyanobacteria bacterium HKST-UBA02]